MNVSEVDICNLALSYVGGKAGFMAFTDKQIEASKCKFLYPKVRDIVLASVDWPFARKARSLGLRKDIEQMMGWRYAYAMPGDVVTVQYIVKDTRDSPPVPYEIFRDATERESPSFSSETQSGLIYTDKENAVLAYTGAMEDPAFFHPLFVEALAWNLGARLVSPLGLPMERQSFANKRYFEALSQAGTVAANQEHNTSVQDGPDWIKDR